MDVEIWVAFWEVWRFLSFLTFWVICGVHFFKMNSQFFLPIAGMFFAVSAYLTMYDPGKISSHLFFLNDVVEIPSGLKD